MSRYAVEPRESWVPPLWVIVDSVSGITISRHESKEAAREIAQGMNRKKTLTGRSRPTVPSPR